MENEKQVLTDDLLPPVRSTFLTVLCVLTFLGSAMGIFSSISSLTASKMMVKQGPQMDKEMEKARREELAKKNDAGSKFSLKMIDSVSGMMDQKKITKSGISGIVAGLLTLLGAILMWRLNATGFYIYIAGIVLGIAAPIIIFGTDSFIAIMSALFSGFIGVIFIVMYAFNLKDMKPKVMMTS